MSEESLRAAMSAPIRRDPEPVEIQTDTSLLARIARLWDSWFAAFVGGRWL
jgi:hypothetical protein